MQFSLTSSFGSGRLFVCLLFCLFSCLMADLEYGRESGKLNDSRKVVKTVSETPENRSRVNFTCVNILMIFVERYLNNTVP